MRAAILVALALGLTLLSPTWLLLLTPIVLGVPHVASDVRFLIIRPLRDRLMSRWTVVAIVVPIAIMAVLRAWSWWTGSAALLGPEVWLGCAAVAGAVVFAPGAWWRRGVVIVAAVALAFTVSRWPWQTVLAFGHLHNLVAFAVFCLWSRQRAARLPWPALATYVASAAILLVGVPMWHTAPAQGLSIAGQLDILAPGLGADFGTRVIGSYAFAQLVHYFVWLDFAPHALGGPSARRELGTPIFAATALATVALMAWGLMNPLMARNSYLSLVVWHGWLELAALGHLWVRAGRLVHDDAGARAPVASPAGLEAAA